MTSTKAEIGAYRRASLDASIASASPHHLIALLFEGARAALTRARIAIGQKNVPGRGEAISKALAIIVDGLKASLDFEKGGELAQRLGELYDYMIRELVIAGRENSVTKIDHVDSLLATIEDGWRQIGTPKLSARESEPAAGPAIRPSISYGKA